MVKIHALRKTWLGYVVLGNTQKVIMRVRIPFTLLNLNNMDKDNENTEVDKTDKKLHISDVIESVCPECGEPLIEKWSGVKCSKCEYWECY